MRNSMLMSAAALGLALAAPAFAQTGSSDQPTGAAPHSAMIRPGHVPGVGLSYPASSQASNINHSDTRSPIAPRLPSPQVSENSGPKGYLSAAKTALMSHQTGKAQQALEMAQTRMLDRAVPPDQASQPATDPRVAMVESARQALAHGNTRRADHLITEAMAQPDGGMMDHSGMMGQPGMSNQPGAMSQPGMMNHSGMMNHPGGMMRGQGMAAPADGTTAPDGTPVSPGTSGTTGGAVQP